MLRTQVFFTRVTRLCMCIAGDSVADTALDPVRLTDIVTAGLTGFEMVSTEWFGTKATAITMRWASDVVTLCAGRGVIRADYIIANSTLTTVSPTDLLPARLTRCQVFHPEGVCANLTLAAVGLTEFVAATGAVGSVIRTDGFTTCSARGGIGFADTPIARGTRC